MRILGAGGCMDNRVYEVGLQDAWQLIFECLNDLGVDVDSADEGHHVVKARHKGKLIDLAVKPLDEEAVEIIFDLHKESIEVYTWKLDNSIVDDFFKMYERKLVEMRAFVRCPNCGTKVRANAKFCPECGTKLSWVDLDDDAGNEEKKEKKGFFASLFK